MCERCGAYKRGNIINCNAQVAYVCNAPRPIVLNTAGGGTLTHIGQDSSRLKVSKEQISAALFVPGRIFWMERNNRINVTRDEAIIGIQSVKWAYVIFEY